MTALYILHAAAKSLVDTHVIVTATPTDKPQRESSEGGLAFSCPKEALRFRVEI